MHGLYIVRRVVLFYFFKSLSLSATNKGKKFKKLTESIIDQFASVFHPSTFCRFKVLLCLLKCIITPI